MDAPARSTSGAALFPKCSIPTVIPFTSTVASSVAMTLRMFIFQVLDEGVVAVDPAVRGEDEDVEPNRHHVAAVLVNGLPAELNDLTESLGVFAPTELEPFGGTQCS